MRLRLFHLPRLSKSAVVVSVTVLATLATLSVYTPKKSSSSLTPYLSHVADGDFLGRTLFFNRSRCFRNSEFVAEDDMPHRSPMVLADLLFPHVEGKFFCEFGTRKGDHHACLTPHVRGSLAFEVLPNYCANLKRRNLPVVCGDVREVDSNKLNDCEVYFWWPQRARDNLGFFKLLVDKGKYLSRTAIVAFDAQNTDDMFRMRQQLAVFTPDIVYTVPFHEGVAPRQSGIFMAALFNLDMLAAVNFSGLTYLDPTPFRYSLHAKIKGKRGSRTIP